jgi:hypothetical protein
MKSGVPNVENWLAWAPHKEMQPNRELSSSMPQLITTPTPEKSCVRKAGTSLFVRLWSAKFFIGNGPEFLVGQKFRFALSTHARIAPKLEEVLNFLGE